VDFRDGDLGAVNRKVNSLCHEEVIALAKSAGGIQETEAVVRFGRFTGLLVAKLETPPSTSGRRVPLPGMVRSFLRVFYRQEAKKGRTNRTHVLIIACLR
jgi:hypothetical protein